MITYEKFQKRLLSRLEAKLGEDFLIQTRQVIKNNGLILDGICIIKKGSAVSPTFYANYLYEEYCRGRSLRMILSHMLETVQTDSLLKDLDPETFTRLDLIRDHILCRLINTERNAALLSRIPHLPFLDMSIVFYLSLGAEDPTELTSLIENSLFDQWNLSAEELFSLALANTGHLLPPVIRPIREVLESIAEATSIPVPISDGCPEERLYVCSNARSRFGAATLLFPDTLKAFADAHACDLVILPSSIHELILCPLPLAYSTGELYQIVREVNRTEVAPEEVLSDSVYVYRRGEDHIRELQAVRLFRPEA